MFQINIQIKSFDSLYIEKTLKKIYKILIYLKITDFKTISFPESVKKLTLLRSPHIDKKSREQFGLKTYKSLFIILPKKKSYIFLLLHFLKNSEFFGVELKISVKYNQFFTK